MAKQVVNMRKKEGLELLKKIKDHFREKRISRSSDKDKEKKSPMIPPPIKGSNKKDLNNELHPNC
ncbi:hypothetical protein [Peribacillus sp. ACCC06369]|uniref:hypothetical protein n=1 Tax=Peribacillus sp. ACCC06369 TaxID=3055860 RepID=UPI0025A1E19A|nr:hypothetical protein [Peribacillus sp. ACCC06369]MDM5356780.1 hypothetical protein [Peribacillus sp. ACCC06369]